jgi:(2Fe-2S) ferredoxin
MRIKTLDDLKAVKAEGLKLTYPEKIKIMVGMATCGISAGGDKVYQALAKKIAELGLDVALEMTGCIGFCQREPLVDVVYPHKVRISYQGMTPEKAEALVEAIKAEEIYPENLLLWRARDRNTPIPTRWNWRWRCPSMRKSLFSKNR